VEDRTLKTSVVIRTKDKESYFEPLLKNLSAQTVLPSEIVVVDNYSSQKKLRLLERDLRGIIKKYPTLQRIKLVPISDEEFSHPYSTNLGVSAAESELVCIINAHSMPTSFDWLEHGTKHFENLEVAGVSGFFIPHKDGFVFGKLDALLYYFSQKMISRQGRFCTINCVIRRSLWENYPFDENLPRIIPETKRYGLEDYDWSEEMVARGFEVIIEPAFSVCHSHQKGLVEMTRNFKNYFLFRRIQRKINTFKRPRISYSRVFRAKDEMQRKIEIFP